MEWRRLPAALVDDLASVSGAGHDLVDWCDQVPRRYRRHPLTGYLSADSHDGRTIAHLLPETHPATSRVRTHMNSHQFGRYARRHLNYLTRLATMVLPLVEPGWPPQAHPAGQALHEQVLEDPTRYLSPAEWSVPVRTYVVLTLWDHAAAGAPYAAPTNFPFVTDLHIADALLDTATELTVDAPDVAYALTDLATDLRHHPHPPPAERPGTTDDRPGPFTIHRLRAWSHRAIHLIGLANTLIQATPATTSPSEAATYWEWVTPAWGGRVPELLTNRPTGHAVLDTVGALGALDPAPLTLHEYLLQAPTVRRITTRHVADLPSRNALAALMQADLTGHVTGLSDSLDLAQHAARTTATTTLLTIRDDILTRATGAFDHNTLHHTRPVSRRRQQNEYPA